jgi:leucyl aminopeptidase
VLEITVSPRSEAASVQAMAVVADSGLPMPPSVDLDPDLAAQVAAFAEDAFAGGPVRAGTVHALPRPLATPRRVLLVGAGSADEAGWRAAGASLARAAARDGALTIIMPAGAGPAAVRGVAEGLWLASYSFNLKQPTEPAADDKRLRQVTIVAGQSADDEAVLDALDDARATAAATRFARDLTNTPSEQKTPEWFAAEVVRVAAGNPQLAVKIRSTDALADEGFGGIVAVGSGSARSPRLVELSWQPAGATAHVVLIGKGITFDTGGICIKPRDGMKLMRKDMGGAAAVIAATLGAAEMDLPVRVTALAPLAENMASGSAWRPGDVVTHYGGRTTEVLNTDAEGRVVLADALAYAASTLAPDYVIDLATLTGANAVALGKRTGALYSDNDDLAEALAGAATAAGEKVWRMPLVDDYVRDIRSELADVANSSDSGAGSITAALYLREFTGDSREHWAHIDMSAPSWADGPDGELVKGATGWGVRTLLRWLASV